MPSKKSKKKASRKASAGTPDVPPASGSGSTAPPGAPSTSGSGATNTPNVPPASGSGNAGAHGATSAGEPSGTGASSASAVAGSGAADVPSASTASGSGSTGASGAPPTGGSGGAAASASSTVGDSGAPSQSTTTDVLPSSYPAADKSHLVEKPFEFKPTVKAFGTGEVSSSFSFSGAGDDVRRPSFDPNDYSVRQDMSAAQQAIDRSAPTFEAAKNALLQQKVDRDAETFRRLRGDYDEMAGEVRKLEQDLKAYQTELANLKSTFTSTTGADADKIRRLEADCDEQMAQIRRLEREARDRDEKAANHVDRAYAVAAAATAASSGSRRPSRDLSSELSSIGEADEEGNLRSPDDVDDEEEDEGRFAPDRATSRHPHQHKGKHREGAEPVVSPTLDIDSPHIIADIPPSSATAGTPTSPVDPTTPIPPSFPLLFLLFLLLLLYTLYVLTSNQRERRIWRGANEPTRRHVVSLRTGGTGTGAYGAGGTGAYGMGSWLLGVVPVGWSTAEGPVWDWIAAGLGEVEGMLGGVGRGWLF